MLRGTSMAIFWVSPKMITQTCSSSDARQCKRWRKIRRIRLPFYRTSDLQRPTLNNCGAICNHAACRFPRELKKKTDGTRWFEVKDPEGNRVQFEQAKTKRLRNPKALSSQIIHVGFLVHDRAAEDAFYREILGFRPYWFGGRTDDRIDWVALQVPEGHQWIEYMLTDKDAQMTPQRLGVLNHFSLGVSDMKETAKQLEARGWTSDSRSHIQMGRDGKVQLNVYDPDGTRIEFMEFTPTQPPCCSPFTSSHPSPNY